MAALPKRTLLIENRKQFLCTNESKKENNLMESKCMVMMNGSKHIWRSVAERIWIFKCCECEDPQIIQLQYARHRHHLQSSSSRFHSISASSQRLVIPIWRGLLQNFVYRTCLVCIFRCGLHLWRDVFLSFRLHLSFARFGSARLYN